MNQVLLILLSLTALGGRATAQRPDPLEPMNRGIFFFNEGAGRYVVKPVATAYQAVVPSPIRRGFTSFFANLSDPWSAVNLFLQGRPGDSATAIGPFGTNTVAGGLGFFDVASG